MNKITLKHIITELLKTSDKVNNLKSSQRGEKNQSCTEGQRLNDSRCHIINAVVFKVH